MSRTQKLATTFMLCILLSTILLTAYVAVAHAAPFRPPRTTPSSPSRSRPTATATPDGNFGLKCHYHRSYGPRNCDPNNRPANPRINVR